VQQAGDTVSSIATNLQENHPLLTALNERVDNRLGPGVEKIQEAMSPVHDAIVKVGGAVSFANSLPFVAERVPGLDKVDQTLTRLGTLGADLQQLRSTLRALADEKADKLTQATEAALTDLVARIDGGLAGIQSDVQTLQADIVALQTRLQQRQSQLLLLYNLFAVLVTLLFVWVIYSQAVVIRHYWSSARRPRKAAPTTTATSGPEDVVPPAAS
jgi:outer membrane murein-binding lipoprotein Lpp